jgi:pyruvate kinase
MSLRRTKIVTTLGPASDTEEMLSKLIAAGANVVRLNFSHGKEQDHVDRVKRVRQAAQKNNQVVGILADLQGPKIRVAKFKNDKVILTEGAEFTLDASLPTNAGDETTVGIDYKELPSDVVSNDILLLDDGRIVLTVKTIDGSRIVCQVTVGGELSNNKGINRQGGGLSAPALTDKDKIDLAIAVKLGVDYIALSFVRSAADIKVGKDLIEKAGGNQGIIAKIERIEAIEPETLDEIIIAADGIMVARGDLAVEIGEDKVPGAQKLMIQRARALNKPVITATQMMETMIHNVVPTRAEVSDVANAVLDITDAVMLSAETATGDHPDLVVKTMARICLSAEEEIATQISGHREECDFERVDEAISMATMYTANHLKVNAIISLTESGTTPLLMSRIRTGIPIFGLSRNATTLGKMALYRGVYPVEFDVTKVAHEKVAPTAIAAVQNRGLLKNKDRVIMTHGPKEGIPGGTNSMVILEV